MMNSMLRQCVALLDGNARQHQVLSASAKTNHRINWGNVWPFVVLHAGCLGVFWVGFSWAAFWLAVALYGIRMFAITGFYHRYFSHRAFQTSRWFQCVMAIIGNASVQKGPLWWAAHHRDHHRRSDQPNDLHSPVQRGFWYSHMGWITVEDNLYTRYNNIPDFTRYPELVWMNRYDWVIPVLFAFGLYGVGQWLNAILPQWGTNGWQLLIWGGFISTTVLFHGTCTINSLSHVLGSQRYDTGDASRNNFLLALITLGEGWHNNHHHYPGTVQQGFYWWEVDVTYYLLKLLETLGIVWDLRLVPPSVRDKHSAAASHRAEVPA